MATTFCPRCYEIFQKEMRKKHPKDWGTRMKLDKGSMAFQCKIPRYSIDSQGRNIVFIWDCEKQRVMTYSQEDYLRKRAAREL